MPITHLIDGYRRFRAYGWREQHARWEQLAEAQNPAALVIACSDSRVDPSQIFDTRPGEIFVVRNVANLVPPFEPDDRHHGVSAALEFGITQLNIPIVIVMGHASCGGVHACMTQRFAGKPPEEGGFIHKWVSLLDPAREKVLAEYGDGLDAARAMELESVRVSLANLMSFPFVAQRVADGRLSLHGAYFAITDGRLHIMDESGAFQPC